jgi:cytochrome c-type biogenesis protein CcmH/NrfG
MAGRQESADHSVRELAERMDPTAVEMEVNAVGYALLRMERTEQALAIFELNTRVFPDAFNTWDSLGEAHMTLGHNDEAIRAYQRSLELNPENTNAKTMIERIRSGRP